MKRSNVAGPDIELPAEYDRLNKRQRTLAREKYVILQGGKCCYCSGDLNQPPPEKVRSLPIQWKAFPTGFLRAPHHLHHSHDTGMTLGTVHAYCNAVLWQYHKQ